jgi:hypothetical protein
VRDPRHCATNVFSVQKFRRHGRPPAITTPPRAGEEAHRF